jgi:regulator of replication initiation timing
MFSWFLKKRVKSLEDETRKSFSAVKNDIDKIGKWLKHLDNKDKQLFDQIPIFKRDLASVKDDLEGLKEAFGMSGEDEINKHLSKELPVLDKQTSVHDVQKVVQTAVQSGNLYGNLKGLSSNERLLVMTLASSDLKLSYEDLALLLGKERSTIRGQINSIKQKSEGLIEEFIERNGKKRVFVSDHVKKHLAKYAKVRG